MGDNAERGLFLRLIMCALSRWVENPQPRIFNYFAKRTITTGCNKRLGCSGVENASAGVARQPLIKLWLLQKFEEERKKRAVLKFKKY